MRKALREAKNGKGKTAPNPMVGALIVGNNDLLSLGYHHAAGAPHAEMEALNNLRNPREAHGATLYVTLEPCSTTGRTPPCTEAIIQAGIARVVYGCEDPNPLHRGVAAQILREAGIEVSRGVLSKECEKLNIYWNHRMRTGLPWVIGKCGRSLDGRLSSHPKQRWITSERSRQHAMRLRSQVEAILLGGATVRIDNPHLTLRPPLALQPWRFIWSPSGNIPPDAHVLTDEYHHRTKILREPSFPKVIAYLGALGISSVLIEGGGYTLGEAFDHHLIDEVFFYQAPILQGGAVLAIAGQGIPWGVELDNVSYRQLGDDLLISGLVKKPLR